MEILGWLRTFKSSVETLKSSIVALEKELELKRRRREDLRTLPLNKAELVDTFCNRVRKAADKYPTTLLGNFNRFSRELDPLTGEWRKFGYTGDPFHILRIADTGKREENADVEQCLMYFFADEICDGIKLAAEKILWEGGPSRAERVAELDRLDREIAEIEEKLRDMATTAAEAGISISPPKMGTGDGRKIVAHALPDDKGSVT